MYIELFCASTEMPSEKPRLTIYLDAATKAELEVLAALNDRPVSNYVLHLVKREIQQAKASGVLTDKTQQ
ncbi:MAG: hypothetical protein B0A82_07590 [Alkalinema sp. CACIAM 70d]|nr:MAG: hypothetical protein B0A82_07590 [Alkalinema sp. CACIAM 70d]